MKEITLYQADDGRIFDNRSDCVTHEVTQQIKNTGIEMYDKDGNAFDPETFLSDDTYNSVEAVAIRTEQDLKDIKRIYEYTGFYDRIDKIGIWFWNDEQQRFVMKA